MCKELLVNQQCNIGRASVGCRTCCYYLQSGIGGDTHQAEVVPVMMVACKKLRETDTKLAYSIVVGSSETFFSNVENGGASIHGSCESNGDNSCRGHYR